MESVKTRDYNNRKQIKTRSQRSDEFHYKFCCHCETKKPVMFEDLWKQLCHAFLCCGLWSQMADLSEDFV